jgi:hypothetical protein
MNQIAYPAQQFNFFREWHDRIWKFFKTPAGISALRGLENSYLDLADFKFEETSGFDREYALEVLELDRHRARVCVKDLDWLREKYESDTLASFSLSLAEALYPNEQWTIEENNEHSVVTDERRSLVFDIKYYDELSAPASLCLAGVPGTEAGLPEVEAFFKKRYEENKARTIRPLTKPLRS